MRLNDIIEAKRTGSIVPYADFIEDYFIWKLSNNYENYFMTKSKNETEVIAYFQISINDENILQNAYVDKAYRNKGIFKDFIWFLKTREQLTPIRIGDYQSNDMIETIKRLSLHFKTFWKNKETGELVPYEPSDIENFYGNTRETPWDLFLEDWRYEKEVYPLIIEWHNIKPGCQYSSNGETRVGPMKGFESDYYWKNGEWHYIKDKSKLDETYFPFNK